MPRLGVGVGVGVGGISVGVGFGHLPAPVPPVNAITIDPIASRSGNVFTFTARRTANLSNAETRQVTVAASSNYAPAATAADFGGAFPTVAATFAAGSATASFAITSPSAIPE